MAYEPCKTLFTYCNVSMFSKFYYSLKINTKPFYTIITVTTLDTMATNKLLTAQCNTWIKNMTNFPGKHKTHFRMLLHVQQRKGSIVKSYREIVTAAMIYSTGIHSILCQCQAVSFSPLSSLTLSLFLLSPLSLCLRHFEEDKLITFNPVSREDVSCVAANVGKTPKKQTGKKKKQRK